MINIFNNIEDIQNVFIFMVKAFAHNLRTDTEVFKITFHVHDGSSFPLAYASLDYKKREVTLGICKKFSGYESYILDINKIIDFTRRLKDNSLLELLAFEEEAKPKRK